MQRSTNSQNDNEVSIIEIVNILLNKKIFILVTTLIAGIFSVSSLFHLQTYIHRLHF